MNRQRHVIKRQMIEISIDKNMDAWSLQQQISRMIPSQIMPLIDKYCSEMSSANQIHRIDQLELDLGGLDADNFKNDFAAKFADALRRGLAEQINSLESEAQFQHSSSVIASHLELFSLFVQKGLLPWWADFQQPGLPEDSLTCLLREAPNALRDLLTELVCDSHALQRLVRYFNDSYLIALLELALPTFSDFPILLYQTLVTADNKMVQLSSMPPSHRRAQLWQAILQTAVIVNPPDRLNLFRETTSRWAADLGLTDTELLATLLKELPSKESTIGSNLTVAVGEQTKQKINFDSEWQAILAILNEYLPETLKSSLLATQEATSQSNDSTAGFAKLEAWLKAHNTDLLTTLTEDFPESLQQSLLIRLKTVNNSAVMLTELKAWISEYDAELPPAMLLRLIVFEQLFSLTKNATPEQILRTNQTHKRRKNDPDELYIDNAGLVILWPFLNHFFERLGLVQQGKFLNDATVQRGVALLQYLATEDSNPPEYLLALNKLLCNMELEAMFHLESPLTETEMDECNVFLDAVIEQAPILNKMSVAGFRGSFLLRQGILNSRDGANLLQIERETYDIVLDRLPWGMDWVKLPWMPTSLRVEW